MPSALLVDYLLNSLFPFYDINAIKAFVKRKKGLYTEPLSGPWNFADSQHLEGLLKNYFPS